MRRRPLELAALAASLLACFAIAACGGDDDAIKSNTTAEKIVKDLRTQRCQEKISVVRCTEHGDDWNCTWDGNKGTGEVSLPKSGTGQLAMSC
jgi:hypothetical protein